MYNRVKLDRGRSCIEEKKLIWQPLRILGQSLLDLWENLLVLVTANLAWGIALIPVLGLSLVLGGLLGTVLALVLLVIIVAPVTLGLYSLTAEVDRREKLELGDFRRGVRQNYRRAWLLGSINVIFFVLLLFNWAFYSSGSVANTPLSYLFFLWIYVGFLWFSMQLFLWPLAARMDKVRLLPLLRNGVLAALKYPLISFGLGLVMAIFFLLSFYLAFLPVILFGMSFYALIGNKALTVVLQRERERAARQEQQGGNASPYQVDLPELPSKEAEAVFPGGTLPPGVKRRGSLKDEG